MPRESLVGCWSRPDQQSRSLRARERRRVGFIASRSGCKSSNGPTGNTAGLRFVDQLFAQLDFTAPREDPTVRETSNPVFRSLPKQRGGYAQFGSGVAGAATQSVHQADPYAPYVDQRAGVSRPLTIDDVVTKTGITLAVLSAVAVASYFMVQANQALAGLFSMVGAF